ncbi:polysaccharide deacetylase family protein [Paenibacillus agricola]|uniref:Polysaccharide deacetylase family protein n=1 Tax=Paenibacillus agricola TaxID=2716264 RepID=A0ABX0JC99_9BACL|nr:polysaccharide deacetylase family protein [Paenibacillus agricola]NHN31839.1 polysaccharide deacetylase family protein [Paenibacillus agricola]
MYHHIAEDDRSSSTITSQLFREQLTYLRSKGYHFITLDELKKFLAGAAVPDKAVLVTFDDGYESFYTLGFPILKELQIPAVNFIITETLDHPQEDTPPKLSREQIIAMTSTSDLVDAECHTHAFHGKRENGKAYLLQETDETDQQYVDRIVADTQACAANVEQIDLIPVDSLAYPFGTSDKNTNQAMQIAGIHYAFTIQPLMATRGVDPLHIPRINAGAPQVTPEGLDAQIRQKIIAVRK